MQNNNQQSQYPAAYSSAPPPAYNPNQANPFTVPQQVQPAPIQPIQPQQNPFVVPQPQQGPAVQYVDHLPPMHQQQQPVSITNTIVVTEHQHYVAGRAARNVLAIYVIIVYSVLLYWEIKSIANIQQYWGGLITNEAIPVTLLVFTILNLVLAIMAMIVEYQCCSGACARCGQQTTRYIVWILLSIGQFVVFILPVSLFVISIMICADVTNLAFNENTQVGSFVGTSCGILIAVVTVPCLCCFCCVIGFFRATHHARPWSYHNSVAMDHRDVVVVQQQHHGHHGHHVDVYHH